MAIRNSARTLRVTYVVPLVLALTVSACSGRVDDEHELSTAFESTHAAQRWERSRHSRGMGKDKSRRPEVCNFRDDDGDGQVDEGYDWVVAEWETILETDLPARFLRAIPLSDGRVAVAGWIGTGTGDDVGYALILGSDAVLDSVPVYTDISTPNVGIVSLAESTTGEIGAIYGTNNFACGGGCPTLLTRLDASSGSHIATTQLDYGSFLSVAFGWDIEWGSLGFVTASDAIADGAAHFTWFDETGSTALADLTPVSNAGVSQLLRGAPGIAWATQGDGIHVGVYSSDGMTTLMAPTLVADLSASLPHNTNNYERGLAWVEDDVLIAFTQSVDGVNQPRVARWALTGDPVIEAVDVGDPNRLTVGVAVLDETVVVATTDFDLSIPDKSNSSLRLHRLDTDLQLIPEASTLEIPGGPAEDATYYNVVATDSSIMLVRATNFRRTVEAAILECPRHDAAGPHRHPGHGHGRDRHRGRRGVHHNHKLRGR